MTQWYARLATNITTHSAVDSAGSDGGKEWRFHLQKEQVVRATAKERSRAPGLAIQTGPMLRDHLCGTCAVHMLL